MAKAVQMSQHRNQANGLYATLHLQAEKINELLLENERLAANNQSLSQEVLALEAETARLRAWYDLATQRLQTNDLGVAQQQLDILWSYVQAMGSPEHRAVTFLNRLVSKLWLGRVCKRGAKWVYAILKA